MQIIFFYHITRLLAEFGVKWTPLVAWVGAQPLFSAYFGINSPRMPQHDPTTRLFTPKAPSIHFSYVAN